MDNSQLLRTHTAEEIEDADFRQVANPSDTIVLPENSTRGEIIRHLSHQIPRNDYGLPLFYIRSDMVDWTQIEAYGHVDQSSLDSSVEALSYDDGYPTLKSGSPFWTQMAHEPHQAYVLFQRFLELAEDEGIRLLDTLSTQEATPLENLRELALEYYWSARSKAYDLFIVAAEAKKREARTRKMENNHYDVAGGVLDKIIGRINDEPELISKMDAKDLLDTFEMMVKVQRLSLGLTGQAASSTQQLPMNPGASVEVIMRSLTKNAGLSEDAQIGMHERLALLMGDSDTAMKAQELVIRATTGNEVYKGG